MPRMNWVVSLMVVLLGGGAAWAAVPGVVNHQGVVRVGGEAFNGDGAFRFAFVDTGSGVNLWTNDGTQVGVAAMPDSALAVPVLGGLYNVELGGTGMAVLPEGLFDSPAVALRIWFDDGHLGPQQLTPDQAVTSSAYALRAGGADTLDGQEASAFAEASHSHNISGLGGVLTDGQVPNDITVDHAGTAGDADTLDGQDSADFAAASHGHGFGEISGAVTDAQVPDDITVNHAGDADTLDGADSSAFMAAGTDNWVDAAGDTMSGSLFVNVDSSSYAVGAQNAGIGPAVRGIAMQTGDVENIGGHFTAGGDSGRGVYANSPYTGGFFEGTGSYGRGVQGYASATGSVSNCGGYFVASGGSGTAVYGNANAVLGTNTGGDFSAAGSNGKGVAATASNEGGYVNYGGYFTSYGLFGRGVHGQAANAGGGTNYGGRFEAAGSTARAVYGLASHSGGYVNYGGYFEASGSHGYGVYGHATGSSGDGVMGESMGDGGYGGVFKAHGDGGIGVLAEALATGAVTNYGAYFSSYGDNGRGCRAAGAAFDFYAAGSGVNYGPFTGGHEAKLSDDFPVDFVPGMVVAVTGETQVRQGGDGTAGMSSTLPTVRLADRAKDPAVFGALVKELSLDEDHWYAAGDGERFATVNALGEGRVWVCDANGKVGVGDYVTTSDIAGYAQRQEEVQLCNFTLGKAIEAVNWDEVDEVVEVGGKRFKVYLMAVVYVSG